MPKITLTSRLVRETECPEGQNKIDLFDEKQTGFLVEIRRRGGKTYYQRYTDDRGSSKLVHRNF